VVYINYGDDANKLAVIVDIIDHNRALIDGPTTGVARHSHPYRRLTLTDLVIKNFPRGARSATVKKCLEKDQTLEKWNKTSWAKKVEIRKKKIESTDFERFKLLKLKKQRRYILQKEVAKLLKAK